MSETAEQAKQTAVKQGKVESPVKQESVKTRSPAERMAALEHRVTVLERRLA